jgi:hypothetical protein
MNGFARIVAVGLCGILVGCAPQQPLRKRTIEAPTLSCEDANRLAYRTVTTLGYTVASLQVGRPGQPGHIVAEKDGGQVGTVTITCHESGATVEPQKSGLPIPTLIGAAERPHEFQNLFQHTFNILRSGQEYAAHQGPAKGLTMTMTRLNSFESQMDLGADLPANGVLPIKVEINNNTPRPYGLDTGKVYLQSAGGSDRIAPVAPPAAGQGKALQGEITIQPGQSVTGYLFYPAGNYSSARTTLIDKENDEGEGFSVQF